MGPGCSECTDYPPNACETPTEPTNNDPEFMTYRRGDILGLDPLKYTPWRSPGFAPVFSPCGIAGGGAKYVPGNGAIPPKGIEQGFDGKDMPVLEDVETVWPKGTSQEVSWAIHANHGGGYAYRLCPRSSELSEACFQSHHLKFADDKTWIQYGADVSNRTAIKAPRLSAGTNPAGSTWKKNPLPACGDLGGGVGGRTQCTYPPQFEEPLPGLYGYGAAACHGVADSCTPEEEREIRAKFAFNMVDLVEVPADLPSGDYVLSFRWDCEQTKQVWAQCADIRIVDGSVAV